MEAVSRMASAYYSAVDKVDYSYCIREWSRIIGIKRDFRRAGDTETSVVHAIIEMSYSRNIVSGTELLGVLAVTLYGNDSL